MNTGCKIANGSQPIARALCGLCMILTLGSACAEVAQEQEPADDAPAFEIPPAIDDLDPSVLETFKNMPAPPYEGDPGASSLEDTGADDEAAQKIRNGVPINYNHLFANSVVQIIVPPWNGCTAQVINKYMLLTAAHCIPIPDPGAFAKSFEIIVNFTQRDGRSVQITQYGDRAYASQPSTGHDLALFYLPSGIGDTCYNTLSWCAANRPDIPVNGQFQYYLSSPWPIHTNYLFAGYGTTDNATGGGVLRTGNATIFGIVRNNGALTMSTTWSNANQARPCKGDSGSPLIPAGTPYTPKPSPGRSFYTGVAKGGTACTSASGHMNYTLLEGDDATWAILNLAWIFGGLYTCGTVPNLPANTLGLECANGV